MKKKKLMLAAMALLLGGCLLPDTTLPGPGGPYLIEPLCENEEEISFLLGNPDYCYPDLCCTWSFYDYDGWFCEETWCRFDDMSGCWWETTDVECW